MNTAASYSGPINMSEKSLPLSSLFTLVAIAVGGGIGTGIALFLSSKIIYLIFFSIVLAAVVCNFILDKGIKLTKVRNGMIGLLAGVLIAAVTYGTFRYAEYWDFKREATNDIKAEDSRFTQSEINEIINLYLEDETGSSGFWGFINLTANEGMSISSRHSMDSEGNNIGRELTIIYWGLEILIIVGMVALAGRGSSLQPFCEDTNEWLVYDKIGQVASENINDFMGKLQQGDFHGASQLMVPQAKGAPTLIIEMGRCHTHSASGLLRIKALDARNKEKDVLHTHIPAQQYNELLPTTRSLG